MATKAQLMHAMIHDYRRETGKKEIDMHDVAKYAASRGWKLPTPAAPLELLARQFSDAAREEVRRDAGTGRSYRANHAFSVKYGTKQMTLWVDIDEAPRPQMLKALQQRREQMVGDAVQLSLDAEHWNSRNQNEDPIQMVLDFTDDVEWRLNAPKDETG